MRNIEYAESLLKCAQDVIKELRKRNEKLETLDQVLGLFQMALTREVVHSNAPRPIAEDVDMAIQKYFDSLLPPPSSPEPAHATPVTHSSDCAVYNMPAYPAGPCDCGAVPAPNQFGPMPREMRDYISRQNYEGKNRP